LERAIIAVTVIACTIITYMILTRLYQRFTYPLLMPVLTTMITIIVLLLCFDISYETYMIGGEWLDKLLGPAIVSLAYPLYKQRNILLKQVSPILGGIVVGSVIGVLSGLTLTQLFGFTKEQIFSMVPKSITTPVAMQVTSDLGGIPSLTVVFVMIAGFTGILIGPYVLKWFRIQSSVGRGVAFGSASHAIGTSKALEYNELTFAVSSVAMTLSAILGSMIAPFIVYLYYL
jgi:predicted murein hydrolase (TIGR00659 family)